jgi:DNA processing protein
MTDEKVYEIALAMINGIGPVQAKNLVNYFGTASAVFKAGKKDLSCIEGIGTIKADEIKAFDRFKDAEKELAFCNKHRITVLFLTDEQYPQRLLHCYDAPTVLYYRGNADLNASKMVSIIGTRNNTGYGRQITEQIVAELAGLPVTIVSGLALGIDGVAHKAAITNNLPTIAVLAHGLDTIYPSQHKSLAKEMLLNGGLLTECTQHTKADKHNFPKRNRIVAGISDATIVIETANKGGSMITAELAYNYNRDLFAVPGKITDSKSSGCLKLVQQQKAIVYSTAANFLMEMGWNEDRKVIAPKQQSLFVEVSEDEKNIINLLEQKEVLHIDELYHQSGLSSSSVAAAILDLELQNIIIALPGKMYKLV